MAPTLYKAREKTRELTAFEWLPSGGKQRETKQGEKLPSGSSNRYLAPGRTSASGNSLNYRVEVEPTTPGLTPRGESPRYMAFMTVGANSANSKEAKGVKLTTLGYRYMAPEE